MSSVPAQKFREAVFQILFSLEVGEAEQESLEFLLSRELGISRKNIGLAYQRALKILEVIKDIDAHIAQVSVTRIAAVEKAVLRLGVFEVLMDEDIPPKVALSEAIRLTRKFSSPQAAAFVNAVLDSIYKKSLGIVPDENAVENSERDLQESIDIAAEASKEGLRDDSDSNQD